MERQNEGAAPFGGRGPGLTAPRGYPVKAPLCRTFSPCESPGPPLDTRHRQWPVRLSVRTPGFQPGKRGSTPLRAATSPDSERTGSATCRKGGSVFPRLIHFVLRCFRNGNEPSYALGPSVLKIRFGRKEGPDAPAAVNRLAALASGKISKSVRHFSSRIGIMAIALISIFKSPAIKSFRRLKCMK